MHAFELYTWHAASIPTISKFRITQSMLEVAFQRPSHRPTNLLTHQQA